MTDIWVCGTCHSINRQRNSRCYKCGSNQAEAATGEMSTLRQERAIANRTVVQYRPSWLLGVAAAIFIVGVAISSIANLAWSISVSGFISSQFETLARTGSFDQAGLDARLATADTLWLIRLAVVLPALLFFAGWLSRVIVNVPALGGGQPGTSSTRAFVYTLIPLVNLRTVPGMLQDALYRLDPTAGGLFLVATAWVGLVGSWIIAFIGGWYLDIRTTFDVMSATSLEEVVGSFRGLFSAAVILDVVTGTLIAIGAFVLILVMFRIELRSQARDREIRSAAVTMLGAAQQG